MHYGSRGSREPERGKARNVTGKRKDVRSRALFQSQPRTVRHRRSLPPHWHLRVPARSAGTVRFASTVAARKTRKPRAAASARGCNEHCRWHRRKAAALRRYPGRSCAGSRVGKPGVQSAMNETPHGNKSIVTFQGEPGAYANLAARDALPNALAMPRTTFEDALLAVREGEAGLTIIPVENSLHGRIADIHHLLPEAGLHIVGEHFHRVRHQLLGVRGATLSGVTSVFSQEPALGQCRKLIRERRLTARSWHDTAGAARHVAELGDPSVAAIASSLAAELYGLDVLASDIEDETHNVTRFLIMAREPREPATDAGPVITT